MYTYIGEHLGDKSALEKRINRVINMIKIMQRNTSIPNKSQLPCDLLQFFLRQGEREMERQRERERERQRERERGRDRGGITKQITDMSEQYSCNKMGRF